MNLRNETRANKVNDEDLERIWMPSLVFENSPDRRMMRNDASSTTNVRREGKADVKFDFELNEHLEYKGSKNHLVYENIFDLALACQLELHYYPFDTQRCSIVVSFSLVSIKIGIKNHIVIIYLFEILSTGYLFDQA